MTAVFRIASALMLFTAAPAFAQAAPETAPQSPPAADAPAQPPPTNEAPPQPAPAPAPQAQAAPPEEQKRDCHGDEKGRCDKGAGAQEQSGAQTQAHARWQRWYTPWEELPKDTLTVNVAGLFFGAYLVEYERAVRPHLSLGVEGAFLRDSGTDKDGNATRRVSNGVNVLARFFPFGRSPRGLFVSPEVNVSRSTVTVNGVSATGTPVGVGLFAGYTLLIVRHIDVSLGVGGLATLNPVVPEGAAAPARIAPLFRTNVGVAF